MRRVAIVLAAVLVISIGWIDAEAQTGVTGRVTRAVGGTGIEGVQVHFYELGAEGVEIAILFTDGDGYYTSEDPMNPGIHFARTVDTLGFVDEVYDDIECPFWCDAEIGMQIVVEQDQLTVVDFELEAAASIAGTVVSSATEPVPIENAEIMFFDAGGGYQISTWSDAGGVWDSGAVFPEGSFFARVSRADGYVGELYDDIACPYHPASCDPATGTPIELAPGDTSTGHAFVLDPGGSISGEITDGAPESPVEGAFLLLFDAGGDQVSIAFSDAVGAFTNLDGLTPGSYFVQIVDTGFPLLIPELYDDIWCPFGCDPTGGTPVPVMAEEDVVGVDFDLESFGAVSGSLVAQDTGEGIPGSYVELYASNGDYVATALDDEGLGTWATGQEILPGQYYALSISPGLYIDQVYDGIDCLGCDVTTGTLLTVDSGATTENIDFVLTRGSTISGLITDAVGFGALPGVQVLIFNAENEIVTGTVSTGSGTYQTEGPLAAGTYFVATYNESGYIDKVWDDVVCNGCNVTEDGTPVEVAAATDVTGIDFVLAQGGSIAGSVTLEGTTDGIDNILVGIFDAAGNPVTTAVTDGLGMYLTEAILPPGFYRALTVSTGDFLPELFDEIPCAFGCEITDGDAIDLGPAQALTGVDFSLELGGWISGTVVDAVGSNPIGGVGLAIYDAAGTLVTGSISELDGSWSTDRLLPTGDYFVATIDNPQWLDQLHDGVPCEGGCDATTGTAIAVTGDTESGGVAFELAIDADLFADGFESGDTTAWIPAGPPE